MTAERLRLLKLLLTTALLGAGVAFLLPFLALTVDERLGRGTGVELATGNAELSGRYVHSSYEGHVEDGLGLAERPTMVALVLVVAAAAAVWIPGRRGFVVALVACGVALLSLVWLRQAVSGPQLLAEVEWDYGSWLALVLILLSGALAGLFLYRTSWGYLNR